MTIGISGKIESDKTTLADLNMKNDPPNPARNARIATKQVAP
jgi:hypothetical protein